MGTDRQPPGSLAALVLGSLCTGDGAGWCREAGMAPGRDVPGWGVLQSHLMSGQTLPGWKWGCGLWALPRPAEQVRGQQWLCAVLWPTCNELCRSQPDSPWLLGRLTSQLEVKMLVRMLGTADAATSP